MTKIDEKKELTEKVSVKNAPLPDTVYISLVQHLGKPNDLLDVGVGDIVKTGQLLAHADALVTSPIHSSVNGKVLKITDWPHPVLGKTKTIVIERDKEAVEEEFVLRSKEEVDGLSIDQLRNIIKDCGIVGMGGATFPSHVKLAPPKPIDSLIINGAECEPYLTSDNRLMVENPKEILEGVCIIAKILNTANVYIAVEDNKPEAIKEFKNQVLDFKLKVLKTQYPQGAEKQLIYSVLKRKVPSGKLPFEVGVVVHNVATAFAIFEAVYKNKPLYERIVTVTGDIFENPGNFKVRIGTPIKDLISIAGPLKKEIKKIIMGGPMMGIAQGTDEVPIIKGSSGVLVLADDEVAEAEEGACIRCGECIKNCPMGLSPALISAAASKGKWDLAKDYGLLDCVECGLCAYSCPVNKNIVQWVKYAKTKIKR